MTKAKIKKQTAIILDLDNILFDSVELEAMIPDDSTDREAWNEFHKHLHEPKPISTFVDMAWYYFPAHDLIFITSREDIGNCREITEKAICTALGFSRIPPSVHVLMRPANCYDSSQKIKSDLYEKEIKDFYDIRFALDDSLKNAKMWLSKGIISLQRIM